MISLRLVFLSLIALISGASALAVDPVVTTGLATAVTDHSATFNGTANANWNGSLFIYFEYGTTTTYSDGVVYPQYDSISGNTTNVETASVSTLQPGTTYHYRLRGLSNTLNKYFYGADQTFTTAVGTTPPTVGTTTPGIITSHSASIGINALTTGSSPATVVVEYGLTAAYGSSVTYGYTLGANTSLGGSPLYVAIPGLAPATTYHYRVDVSNGQGAVSTTDATFTTFPTPVLTTGSATGVSDLTATLNGTVASGGAFMTASFDVGLTTSYGTSGISSPGVVPGTGAFSATSSIFQPNTTYHYRIKAWDYTNTLFYGNDMTFTTGAPATPPTFGGVDYITVRAVMALMYFDNISSGSSPATLSVDYGPTTAYGATATSPTSIPTNTLAGIPPLLISGLAPVTTYHYRVTVTNGQGSVSSADATFTTRAAPIISTGAVTGLGGTAATLTGSVNPNGGEILGEAFDIGTSLNYGTTINATPDIVFSGTSASPESAPLTGLLPNTTYHYRLHATDDSGSTFFGADATFTTASLVQSWRQQYFGTTANTGATADTASFAGDGVSNLMKYALGLDPTVPCAGALPTVQLKSDSENTYLSYTFPRDPAKTDLTYQVVAASSINGPWTPLVTSTAGGVATGPGLVAETAGSGGMINVEVQDPLSTTSATTRFLKLVVTDAAE